MAKWTKEMSKCVMGSGVGAPPVRQIKRSERRARRNLRQTVINSTGVAAMSPLAFRLFARVGFFDHLFTPNAEGAAL